MSIQDPYELAHRIGWQLSQSSLSADTGPWQLSGPGSRWEFASWHEVVDRVYCLVRICWATARASEMAADILANRSHPRHDSMQRWFERQDPWKDHKAWTLLSKKTYALDIPYPLMWTEEAMEQIDVEAFHTGALLRGVLREQARRRADFLERVLEGPHAVLSRRSRL
ncbi:MAG: hypothetical protein AAGC76_05025 [Luteibacter sp.]|uniref:hypothetical protein n=1 Tax=Luteibacter sp. TaxID=1886636 RepID=UPI002807B1BB|nr:hypothetical protein [Luteibacter sp.]MDQ7995199.1 hypothetical protein [Luteibacter sp.]